ncbi:hypothetical protein [Streptomyces sp. CMSTAAHL-2]|uniref:hypothetical protein n=1 Tax=Streptomyces sp. CMSTAAHL-2 TaxID=2904522 RepID=UPI001E2A4B3C|nr:hypothetical protein [Streptomyces sp. CMSTAAHL-2]MCE3030290.1 hypothetical protein [Streptomyces sp. CMSTAAHL-2]
MSSGTTEKPYGWDEDLAQRIYGAAKKRAEQHGRDFTFDDVAQESGATVEEVSKYCNGLKPMLAIKAFEDTVEKMTGLLQSAPPLEDLDHMKLRQCHRAVLHRASGAGTGRNALLDRRLFRRQTGGARNHR